MGMSRIHRNVEKQTRNSTGQFMRGRERLVHISAPIIRNP